MTRRAVRSRTGRRGRWWMCVSALICTTLIATSCTPGGDDPTAAAAVDADALARIADGLADDPITAAEQLVAAILTDDGERSVAATAELLRRAGHAIVSADGSVVAMPDRIAMLDAPVYVELLPMLTQATRAGDRYSFAQVTTLLTAIGLTEEDATPAQLASALGGWAKEAGDHPIFATAAAGVRALAGHRQQVYYAGADPATLWLDPLQTTLVLGHATSRFGDLDPANAPRAEAGLGFIDWVLGVEPAHAAPQGACGEFAALFATPDDPVIKSSSDFLRGELKDRLAGEFLTEGGKEVFDKAGEAWGKGGAVASAILLLLAARLDLTADKTSTHFKHSPGSRKEHITVTATATFDPKIALDRLECYALAGVDVPKPGPMKEMTVRWSTEQPQVGDTQTGGAQLLMAVAADSSKMTRGSKTERDGTATLELKPAVEEPAGEGEKLKGKVSVLAQLDKEKLPFELGDVYGLLSNAVGFGVGKTFDLLKEVLVKAGLPSQTITLDVSYHGVDIIVAQGENDVNLILASLPRVYVDLVSCAGVGGPFTGSAGYDGAASSGMLQAAGALTGVPVPQDFAGQDNPLSILTNDRKGPSRFFIMSGEGGAQFLDGQLSFYSFLNARAEILADGRVGRPVGEVEILLAGNSYAFSDLTWPIVRVREDPRCPKVKYFHDGL